MTRRAWAAFAAVATLWGIPYLFIKIAVDDGVPPVFLAWARIVLGAALLLSLAGRAGLLPRLRGRWRTVAVYAVVEIALPFPLISFGETRISSSLAAILIAAVPIFIAMLAVRFDPAERVTGLRLFGLLMGFGGVVALVGIDVAGEAGELVGAGAVLLAALGYAVGPIWLNRRLGDLDARATMAASLSVAAVVLTPVVALAPPAELPSAGSLASIVVLGVFCTAAAFVLFGMLVAEVGPGRAVIVTYVAPVVAVVLGVVVLGERLGPGAVVGMALILLGSWLATGGRTRRLYVPKRRSPASPRPGRM